MGEGYLVTVTTPLGLTQVSYLHGSRGTEVIKSALMEHIKIYKSRGFEVRTILVDREGAFGKASVDFNEMGVTCNPAASGKHVPVVENKIKQIKERVRAHIHGIPYLLPHRMLKYLVYYCVIRLNQMPSSSRGDGSITSPAEQFTGIKLNYKTDLRIAFGEYAQVESPHTVERNSMLPRVGRQ